MSAEIASIIILTAAQKQEVLSHPSQLTNLANILADQVEQYKCDQ
jgi:hypothetical protein